MEDLPKPVPVNIEDEVRTSFLSYAMSVIISRALPDVRDGLKPVHRRVLYGMHDAGNTYNKPHKKSARIVGDVMGKYHPHGDSAIYDALVRMAQGWNLRYPLVNGQGNFGSIDGDPPAAMRYSEVRMSRLADEMLADIEKDTVDWRPNFDETIDEPEVLPAKVPNLLINGAAGIAVGMATNIPPHNLREVIDATLHIIETPDCAVSDLLKICPAPDFPTGGLIYGYEGVRQAYETGRGAVTMRAKLDIEIGKKEKQSIVVTELPYQVNKARVIEKIAMLIQAKKIDGISDIRDESARGNIRLVMDLKKDAVAQVIVNRLYKLTQLQDRFSIIMLAIVGGRPQVLDFKTMLVQFIQHRKEVVTRRTAYELRKAEARAHVLEGLKTAVDNIDAVVKLIKESADPAGAKASLIKKFELSDIQAQAILDMRLARLTGLERDKIVAELEELRKQITYYKQVLADEKLVYGIIADELKEIRERYGDDRRTEIVLKAEEINEEDLIVEEDMVVTISHLGYIKRNPLTVYRAQRRGGRGKRGMTARSEDFVADLFVASTHAYVLIFTEKGKLFWLKVHEIPQAGRTAKGKPIVNLVPIKQGDRVAAVVPVRDFTEDREILMATAHGLVKKTNLIEYSRVRPSGIIGIGVREEDRVVSARMVTTGQGQQALISTKLGFAIRFPEEQARSMGRSARGVKGINLRSGDEVVSMDIIDREASILTMCENGFGKRTDTKEYPTQSRGGKGVITIKVDERNGNVVSAQLVGEDDDCMIVTDRGKVIRIKMKDIRVIGRNTKGVRLITMEPDEIVVGASRLAEKEDDDGPADGPVAEAAAGANGDAATAAELASEDETDDGPAEPAGGDDDAS